MDVSAQVKEAIGLIIVVVALIAMTPTVVDQIQGLNTTGWTFTGAEGAKALIGLAPFAWVGAILLVVVVGSFYMVHSK